MPQNFDIVPHSMSHINHNGCNRQAITHLAAERDDVAPGEDDLGGRLLVLRLVRPVDGVEHFLRLPVLLVYLLQQRLDLLGAHEPRHMHTNTHLLNGLIIT